MSALARECDTCLTCQELEGRGGAPEARTPGGSSHRQGQRDGGLPTFAPPDATAMQFYLSFILVIEMSYFMLLPFTC